MSNDTILHSLDGEHNNTISMKFFAVLIIISLIAGTTVGVLFSKHTSSTLQPTTNTTSSQSQAKTAGIADKKTFKDKAEGVLREGGIKDEGSYHLERPGGESQNVYLTSTTVDLSPYVGKKVRVWGATFNGQHAGWLMDVGLVEVLQ